MKIKGQKIEEIEVTLSEKEIGYSIIRQVMKEANIDDDAGCDWETDGECVYIGGDFVTKNKRLASMIDAANLLIYEETLKPKFNQEEIDLLAEHTRGLNLAKVFGTNKEYGDWVDQAKEAISNKNSFAMRTAIKEALKSEGINKHMSKEWIEKAKSYLG